MPYLDSLLSSLQARLSQVQLPAFALPLLHPAQMAKITTADLKIGIEEVTKFYELEGRVRVLSQKPSCG